MKIKNKTFQVLLLGTTLLQACSSPNSAQNPVDVTSPVLASAMSKILSSRVIQANAAVCAPDVNGRINVLTQCGARGDGVTDDTAAIQTALNAAANIGFNGGGPTVYLPPATYSISGSLQIPNFVTLKGVFSAPTSTVSSPTVAPTPISISTLEASNTVLLANVPSSNAGNTTPFIGLGNGAIIEGLAIYYPSQNTSSPIPFPATLYKTYGADGIVVQNVLLLNPWIGVDVKTETAGGRHFVNGLYGQPLLAGILVDNNYDAGRIENVAFGNFWTSAVSSWQTNNTVGIEINRSDGLFLHNVVVWGGHTGIKLTSSAADSFAGYGDFLNITLMNNAVGIDSGASHNGGYRIANLTSNSGVYNHDGGGLQITQSTLSGPAPIYLLGGSINLTNSTINASGSLPINIRAGRALFVGNTINNGNGGIGLNAASGVDSIVATGNTFNHFTLCIDAAVYRKVGSGNTGASFNASLRCP